MGGGGGVSHASSYDVDQEQLAQFIQTGEGQQYKNLYDPTHSYAKVGDSLQAYDPNRTDANNLGWYTKVGDDVSPMLSAFKAWQAGNAQTQNNWQNYANAVSANEGGQGDNTITNGAAQSQRQALLGSLANAGNNPAPGLGSMGQLMKNGRPIQMGEVIK